MNIYGAILGAIVPACLCLLAPVAVGLHLYQHVSEDWKQYDDMFRGRYNASGGLITHIAVSAIGTCVVCSISIQLKLEIHGFLAIGNKFSQTVAHNTKKKSFC